MGTRQPHRPTHQLAASHDNGYVCLSKGLAEDYTDNKRNTLLYLWSFGKEVQKLTFRSTTMSSIFRTSRPTASRTQDSSSSHGIGDTTRATTPIDNMGGSSTRREGNNKIRLVKEASLRVFW